VAAADAHVRRPVDVDAVIVGHPQVPVDAQGVDRRVVAPQEPQGPEGGIDEGEFLEEDMPAALQNDRERPDGHALVDVGAGLRDIGHAVPVDPAGTGDRDILGAVGRDDDAHGLRRAGIKPDRRKREAGEVAGMRAALEHRSALEVELDMAFQDDRADRQKHARRDDHTSPAPARAGIDRPLDRGGVGPDMGAGGAEGGHVVHRRGPGGSGPERERRREQCEAEEEGGGGSQGEGRGI
jgi:hypothetical protein